MTDSVIQFNYSDNTYLTSIYVRANTHIETFIPQLKKICDDIDSSEKNYNGRLNWENMVLEIISHIVQWVNRPDGIKIIIETPDCDCNTIYKHTITPIGYIYSDKNIQTSKTLNINSIYPLLKKEIFNGILHDFDYEI